MPLLDRDLVRFFVEQHAKSCGKRVQERRVALKLKQEELAELADVSQPTISHIELGLKTPRDHVKVMIAAALACSIDDLWPNPDRLAIAQAVQRVA